MARENLREKLEAKGWEKEYIDRTVKVMGEDSQKRSQVITKLDKLVYWVAMIVAIAGNFIISIILIPFLITITNKVALSIIIFAIALSFGFLFNILLKDIEDIDEEHHIIAGLFIPALALINIFVITNVSNHFIVLLNIQTKQSPIIIGIVYVFGFLIPYLIDKLLNKKVVSKKQEAPVDEYE